LSFIVTLLQKLTMRSYHALVALLKGNEMLALQEKIFHHLSLQHSIEQSAP
jgi:hypothetical protein